MAKFEDLFASLDAAHDYYAKHVDTVELTVAISKLQKDSKVFIAAAKTIGKVPSKIKGMPASLAAMHAVSEKVKPLIKEIDQFGKLMREAQEAAVENGEKHAEGKKLTVNITEARVLLTGDPDERLIVTGPLKRFLYFINQAEWLLSRFPEGSLTDVKGLVKVVDREALKENDYSLTPGRYVGVASEVEAEDFDFNESIRAIHEEIESLNGEATVLGDTIAMKFKELLV